MKKKRKKILQPRPTKATVQKKNNLERPASPSILGQTLSSLAQNDTYMGDAARLFSEAKIDPATVEVNLHDVIPIRTHRKINGKTPDAYGYVEVLVDQSSLKPKYYLKTAHIDNQETHLHELIHYYTLPYLYAADQQHKKNISISNPVLKNLAIQHSKNMRRLYKKAKELGYRADGNGASIEDTLAEFAVNVTNEQSVTQLKQLGIYDELMAELKRHISTITTVDIPFSGKVFHRDAPRDATA